jgi:hypothetical protein
MVPHLCCFRQLRSFLNTQVVDVAGITRTPAHITNGVAVRPQLSAP